MRVSADPGLSARDLNAALDEARAAAESHLPALEDAYERIIVRMGRETARLFTAQVTASAWQPPEEGNLLDLAMWAIVARGVLSALRRKITRTTTGEPLARIGISWTVTNPYTQAMLQAAGARTGQNLGAAVSPVLRDTLAEAYAEGRSVPQTAALIRERISQAAPAQAHMLARTDLNGLANGGSVTVAKMAGVGYKQWLTAEDDRVRPEHEEADGQTVPVDQPFTVCGESLEYPGDPAGSNECVCNCRCTVVYLDAGEVASAAVQSRGGIMSELAIAPAAVRWISDIAFEGAATDDGRYIMPGALDWRDLPLTLMALTTNDGGGHAGSFVAGRIDKIRRDRQRDMNGDRLEPGVNAIRAEGAFDVQGDNGAEVARLVDDETVRGISIDMAIHETAIRNAETGDLVDPSEVDPMAMFDGDFQLAVVRGTVMAATVCPTPAFANARIAVTASGERVYRITVPWVIRREVVTASAAGLAPMKPPKAWFEKRETDGPTPLTVTDRGQVYGHIAVWDSCHTGKQGVCFQPPASPSGYAFFNLGEVECDDGSRVACGQITMETDHASLSCSGKDAKRHYDHTGAAAADVRASDGRYGIWVAGAVRPGISAEQARALTAAKPSGDWRQMRPGGPLELVAVLQVNSPGFPVPRPEARLVASALDPDGEAVALVAAGFVADGRRLDLLAARAEGGKDALAALTA